MEELNSTYYYEDNQGTQYSSEELQDRFVELTEELEEAEDERSGFYIKTQGSVER